MKHISYKPLWHTLVDKGWSKNQLRLAASLTSNMVANMGKGKGINMETLARICDALKCDITDVIMLEEDEPSTDGGNKDDRFEGKNP
ncbi:MAG: helix-turn-helix domain-containing protein [Eubacteriales bacterium]|nr:helix-turn-helix domain-containing protein [Eubacteriales bacterium]